MKPKEEWGEESTEKEGEGEKREAARWVPLPPSSPLLAEGKGDLGEHEEKERERDKERETSSRGRGSSAAATGGEPSSPRHCQLRRRRHHWICVKPSLPSSPSDLRETVVAVVTIDASPRGLWVVTSPASAVTPSSAPLDVAAFESRPVTSSLPPCCGPTSN
ncbi:uncharacterized protein LOC110268113 [Arachis ipaensis]|uniref:uncharacterized protein LOC110268113 n=1 Tax=Arachis ipaensis TaxID=130454 RepID=UPI000A2B8600|nr:uncharacterized protein LOC110268113 [Arachis ipaensis]